MRWRARMVRVKICGNTDLEHVRIAVEAGADCVGFVVEYPTPVPWNLTCEEATDLIACVPPFVSRAVVTGGGADHVIAVAKKLRPHVLQLHTDNPIDETTLIAQELSRCGIGVIRALRIDVESGKAAGEIPDALHAAQRLEATGIAALLVDAKTESMPAGTGQCIDWQLVRRITKAVNIPVILAGGLTPDNVANAIASAKPYGVDVITGVELERRIKSPDLVKAFVLNAKRV